MEKMEIKTKLISKKLILGALGLWFCIMIFDLRVLLKERKVNPGETFIVEEHGDLGKSSQSSLVCSYFNGRRLLTRVFWYSQNNIMGRDSCPFILRD